MYDQCRQKQSANGQAQLDVGGKAVNISCTKWAWHLRTYSAGFYYSNSVWEWDHTKVEHIMSQFWLRMVWPWLDQLDWFQCLWWWIKWRFLVLKFYFSHEKWRWSSWSYHVNGIAKALYLPNLKRKLTLFMSRNVHLRTYL